MHDHKYLHFLDTDNSHPHCEEEGVTCGPIKTAIGIAILVAAIAVPTAMIAHRRGQLEGIEIGVNRVHMAIDAAIQEGVPFAFYKGDVRLVSEIRTDDSKFRKLLQHRAEQYELIKYTAILDKEAGAYDN